MSDTAFDGSPHFGFVASPLFARNNPEQLGPFLRGVIVFGTTFGISASRMPGFLDEVYDLFTAQAIPSLTTGINGDITGVLSVVESFALRTTTDGIGRRIAVDPPELVYSAGGAPGEPIDYAETPQSSPPSEFAFASCYSSSSAIGTEFGQIRIAKANVYLGPTKFPVCVSRTIDGVTQCEALGRIEIPSSGDGWSHDGLIIAITTPKPTVVTRLEKIRVDIRPTDSGIPPCCNIGPP